MRKIIVTTFMSMDGVLQAPGGRKKIPRSVQMGRLDVSFQDEQTGDKMRQIMSKPFDLLLGRRTYEIFSAYWPYQEIIRSLKNLTASGSMWRPATPVDTSGSIQF